MAQLITCQNMTLKTAGYKIYAFDLDGVWKNESNFTSWLTCKALHVTENKGYK